jgi:hypothetical protein
MAPGITITTVCVQQSTCQAQLSRLNVCGLDHDEYEMLEVNIYVDVDAGAHSTLYTITRNGLLLVCS